MSTVMVEQGVDVTVESRRARRARRRLLARQDRVSAHLAELFSIGALLDQAAATVRGGWTQKAWFTVATATGTRGVTAHGLQLLTDRPVVGACLVGGVVHAAGGPAVVRSQLVQRTLDVTWHALREEPGRPVRWCPSPTVRTLRLLDLTGWNDARGRTQQEVVDLLVRARELTDLERVRCRDEQVGLVVSRV